MKLIDPLASQKSTMTPHLQASGQNFSGITSSSQ